MKVKSIKINCLIILLSAFSFSTFGQEFNCSVSVNVEQLEGTSFDYLENSFPSELESYINDYRWTELEFEDREKIDCQISVNITAGDQENNFAAETILQLQRPIYNTTAQTVTLVISDAAWQFNYPEGRSLIHDDLDFEDLTGFIDFYCYLFLGYDFDTFSPLGGTEYFIKAQNVVDLAQNDGLLGWDRSSNNRRNRFVLISDLLNNNYEPVRTAYYNYHRVALDGFINNPERSRNDLINTFSDMLDAKRRSTSNYLYDLFFDTKSREIASIFSDAESEIKLEVYNILQELDPGHLTEYETLQN